MLYVYPEGTAARVVQRYRAPYPDPIAVRTGDPVTVDPSCTTDVVGWVWCIGPDGRSGWTPVAWIDRSRTPWRMRRDFDAAELTVEAGDGVRPLFAESGFVWCAHAGQEGWLPDGVLQLLPPGGP